MSRILVIDDDASRHADIAAWCERLGLEAEIVDAPPAPAGAPAACVAIHAGYGRLKDGFPGGRRNAEAVHWFLDDPSYLFHEDLEALRALGRSTDAPLVVLTGGSQRDLPLAEMRKVAAGRVVVLWNVFDLIATTSLEQVLAGPTGESRTGRDPERIASEIRHDLLNRLWNLALAASEARPDIDEIGAILEGEEDQSPLELLVSRTPSIGETLRGQLASALERARGGEMDEDLATKVHAAIEEIDAA